MLESLGRRIAALRNERGWTQQRLAERLGLSRVGVSHLEAGLSVPSERTVVLLAGVFRMEPHDFVEGTSYPAAKAERLPVVAARYTEVEHQLALLDADLPWLDKADAATTAAVVADWKLRLALLEKSSWDRDERAAIARARARLRKLRGWDR